jgi:hypothetical protein
VDSNHENCWYAGLPGSAPTLSPLNGERSAPPHRMGLCRLLPEFDGPVRVVLVIAITGIAAYLAFLMTIDVPMYLSRWRAGVADGSKLLGPLEGLRDVSTRWVVTHDLAQWKDEITWMSSLRNWSRNRGHSAEQAIQRRVQNV